MGVSIEKQVMGRQVGRRQQLELLDTNIVLRFKSLGLQLNIKCMVCAIQIQ